MAEPLNSAPQNKGFIEKSLVAGLRALSEWTLFGLVRRFTVPSYWFVEVWVLAFLTINAFALFASVWGPRHWWLSTLVIAFGICRTAEIILIHLNLFLGSGLHIQSTRRTVLLTFLNYMEIIGWFTSFYIWAFYYGAIFVSHNNPAWPLAYQSIVGMVGNSVSVITVQSRIGWLLLSIQSVIGFFMITVVLSRTISSIPRLVSLDHDETHQR